MLLSFLLCIILPNISLLHVFPRKNLYTFLFSPIRATSPFRLIPRDYLQMIFAEDCVSWRSSLCYLFHPLVTSLLLRPNVFNNILFCNTKKLSTSLSVKDQDPHPYKQREKIILNDCERKRHKLSVV